MTSPSPVTSGPAPGSLEAWLARHPRRITGALLLGAIFVRLLLVLQIAAGPLPRIHTIVTDSDNHFFDDWGRHLAAGNWLQAEPFHPMADWMRAVADDAIARDPGLPARVGLPDGLARPEVERRLWDHWMGGTTFYQEPAYPYLVGLTYRLAGADVWHVFVWQLAIGALGVVLVQLLARRLFSETAGLAAGVLALLAPIPLFYEVTLLRDGLVAYATLALAFAMWWATQGPPRRWIALGVAFGVATLIKAPFLLFPLAMAAWRLAAQRSPWRARLAAAGRVAAGMAVALLPLALRNLAVGAPALALNGSARAMLALFHLPGISIFDLTISPDYPRVLLASDGHALASLVEAARMHPHPLGIVGLSLRKLLYAWHGFESPNNVDFYLFRQGAPVLAALPARFAVLLPLAAVGAATRRAGRAWPLYVAAAASVPTIVSSLVLSRYRAPLLVALLPLAGAGVVQAAAWVAGRRWVRLAIAALAAGGYLTWALSSPPGLDAPTRAWRYARVGVEALDRDPALATLYLQEAFRLAPGAAKVEARLAQALLATGDPQGALAHLDAAGRTLDTPAFHELRGAALAASGRRADALAEVRAALTADPGRASARRLLERLEGEPAPVDASERQVPPP